MALVAASCLFLAAMVHAAVTDFRRHKALNISILALALGYLPFAMAVGLDWVAIIGSVVAALLVLTIGFGAFCAGWVDGGDVKLATATTLWIGAETVLPFLGFLALVLNPVTGLWPLKTQPYLLPLGFLVVFGFLSAFWSAETAGSFDAALRAHELVDACYRSAASTTSAKA